MNDYYLLLRKAGRVTEVVYINDGKEHLQFSGGRWEARRFLDALRKGIGWETVPAFCQKKAFKGMKPSLVQITD